MNLYPYVRMQQNIIRIIKNKDIFWYEQQLVGIKKRKKFANKVEDVKARKKMKADLKREQRGAKRAEKQSLDKWIDNEINGIENKY